MWSELRPGSDLLDQPFPKADPTALVQDEIELVIQVNGKLRGNLTGCEDCRQGGAGTAGACSPSRRKNNWRARTPKKIVVVPGRLINMVM